MKRIKTIRFIGVQLLILVVFPFINACEKWLNVLPENETEATQLFSSERGFQEALTGVYTLMSEAELYGRELTYGFADVIAQQYGSLHESSPYFFTQYFDFKSTNSLQLSDAIWRKQYNAIANVNDILAFIDQNNKLFASDMSHDLIKGESLALRAFLHFDLLRLYAPHQLENNEQKAWIPYVDQFSKNTSASLTTEEFMKRVIDDLNMASDLLKEDPILTGKPTTDIYFKNRHYHLNYYAVKGLMARAYLYWGDNKKADAYRCAKEVIDAQNNKGLFPFVSMLDATNTDRTKRDRTFSTEHLFSLNIRALQSFTTGYVSAVQNGLALLPRETLMDIYEGYPDYRQEYFETDGTVQFVPSKFWQVDPTKKFSYRMPMLRISEMYYIAAESTTNISEATIYLNTLRAARNIPVLLSGLDESRLEEELYKEYKKEFFGEGQLFFYYKRHNAVNAGGWTMPFSYIIPMPEDEINFGGRPRPKN
ncbi:RagB/SusD family nutrient uptake outer membrane protein [Sphingobacterium yanglingense]|uniref:SusD-like starch-binding protein associating with outer membrane n=1 Tax=Sphingobacterium yanglingense TaxID=1437280 RepID=A0A4R6WHP9_9SPHI|nr:RagB/SusD family nutrient uptake outer membrane protein [Sphingobacterium yanglingense]TDQ77927.1 SusD-like starch-binding protein associating with outer membrane [Sphingobacterium yanglingense]